jgi:PKHD-type hydroxylase
VGVSPATVFVNDSNGVSDTIRKSDAMLHSPNDNNLWIFEKLKSIAEFINDDFFRYDLTGFEFFQYAVYDGAGSNYNFHMDMAMGENIPEHLHQARKLSFSLVLSDTSEYQGGEFEIKMSEQSTLTVPQQLGRVIAFPSFMLHRVAPLKSGKRKSIVFWVLGPKFK